MAREINKLSDRGVKAEKEQGRYADGNGLYLQVSKSGSKSWLYRFMLDGKAREMGLGSIAILPLTEARKKALDCKKLLREGVDPIMERHKRLAMEKADNQEIPSFKKCTKEYLKAHSAGWSKRHADTWIKSIKLYAYSTLGSMPINTIERSHIIRVLDPIWREKTETANKLRGRIERVLDWATVQDYRKGDNPARWQGYLDKLLPKPSDIHKVKHFAALPYQKINGFMDKLRQREATSALALRLIILTATRSGEVRNAVWSEFDLEKGNWTIPAERMKAEKEHIIPLCPEAISIIKDLPHLAGNNYLFTSPKSGKALSDVVFKKLMERMGITDITTHGFRSTFRDWAAEQTDFPREVIENALAHQLKDKAEAAYFRSNLLDKRRELMNKWGDYTKLPQIKDGKIVHLINKK